MHKTKSFLICNIFFKVAVCRCLRMYVCPVRSQKLFEEKNLGGRVIITLGWGKEVNHPTILIIVFKGEIKILFFWEGGFNSFLGEVSLESLMVSSPIIVINP